MTLIYIQNGHCVWCFMSVVLWHVDVENKVLSSQVDLLFLLYIYIELYNSPVILVQKELSLDIR